MNRSVAIGCGIVIAVFAVLIGLVAWLGPKLFEKGKSYMTQVMAEQAAERKRINAIESAWQPPTAAADATWFPDQVGNSKLERSEPFASIPEMHIERAGHRATYRSGAGRIGVVVLAANDLEKDTLIRRISDSVRGRSIDSPGLGENDFNNLSASTTPYGARRHEKFANGEQVQFWWIKGWLFFFQTHDNVDPKDFSEELLGATAPAAPSTPLEKK